MKRHELIQSTRQLYYDLDDNFLKLCSSRLLKDKGMECICLQEMESLLVTVQQQLDCIIQYLKNN